MKIKASNSNGISWKEVTVKSHIPEELKKLEELARNMWWAWNHEARDLFRSLDKELFEESNKSLARVVDMAENEPDSVSFGTYDDGAEYCNLEDGTYITIKRDKEGNITTVQIRNPGGPDAFSDISYNSDGSVQFDPEGKSVSDDYKEYIENAPFDFEKIKALAERIWAAKPEE